MDSEEKLSPLEIIKRIHLIDSQLGHGRRLSILEVDRLVRESPYADPGGEAFHSLPKYKQRTIQNILLKDRLKEAFKIGYSVGRLDGVKSALEMTDKDVEDAIAIASEMRVHKHLLDGL